LLRIQPFRIHQYDFEKPKCHYIPVIFQTVIIKMKCWCKNSHSTASDHCRPLQATADHSTANHTTANHTTQHHSRQNHTTADYTTPQHSKSHHIPPHHTTSDHKNNDISYAALKLTIVC